MSRKPLKRAVLALGLAAAAVRSGGIDGLIKTLSDKNRQSGG